MNRKQSITEKNATPEKKPQGIRKSEAQDMEKLIKRWERKLERLGLGVLPPLGQSDGFTRLHCGKLDKCRWYEPFENADLMEHEAECFQKALRRLSCRERTIVRLHCGIEEKHCYSFRDLGKIFKITSGRIRQIYEKAIKRLTDYITNEAVNRSRRKSVTNHQSN